MFGHLHQSVFPLYLPKVDFFHLEDLRKGTDLSYVPDTDYFLKRKFMSTANAKNLIASSLGDQYYYFDEMEGRVNFPDLMPVSLLSSALFEKDRVDNHDFFTEPSIYFSHAISVDRQLARSLQSNDTLYLLVQGPEYIAAKKILGLARMPRQLYRCFGLLNNIDILFRAEILMIPPPPPGIG